MFLGGSIYVLPLLAPRPVQPPIAVPSAASAAAPVAPTQESPTASRTETPQLTSTPEASATPLPAGLPTLDRAIEGRFDPNVPADVRLDQGRPYRFAGERVGRYCRAEFPPDGLVWVLCVEIGQGEPTVTPTRRPAAPTRTPSPSPPAGPTIVTYRVDIVSISLDELTSLPGCSSLAMGGDGKPNNTCIVGPGGVEMEMHNLTFGNVYRFTSDVRQLYIGVNSRNTRVLVVGDSSDLPVKTIGNNEVFVSSDGHYKIVVTRER
jgi:hypothetical protein